MTESQLLISRIEDTIYNAEFNGNSFLGFLNEREASEVCSYLKNRGVDFSLYGGYPQATRVYLQIHGSYNNNEFPIKPAVIKSKGNKELSHRDYLGALMGLGIKRECVGDIVLLSSTEAVVFVRDDIFPHIKRDLDKVGRDTVTVSEYSGDTGELSASKEELRIIVSSMRIDNLVSSLANCSRAKASELISDDCVFCNYLQVKKQSLFISQGDIISIRGYGKYIIGDNVGKSRRDNLIINVLHYV